MMHILINIMMGIEWIHIWTALRWTCGSILHGGRFRDQYSWDTWVGMIKAKPVTLVLNTSDINWTMNGTQWILFIYDHLHDHAQVIGQITMNSSRGLNMKWVGIREAER
eukprot:343725_1